MNTSALKKWVPGWLWPAPDSMAVHMSRDGCRSWKTLFYLAWLIWLFIPAMAGSVGSSYWWSIGISLAVFLPLAVLGNVRPKGEAHLYVWAMAILGCVNMPFNQTAWTYGVIACAYVPWYTVRWDTEKIVSQCVVRVVAVEVALLVVAAVLRWPWQELLIMVGMCSASAAGSLVRVTSIRKNAEQRMSADEVRRLAANAERERIGRDLHDLLGHTLSLITLKLELSRKLFDSEPGRARRELGEAEEVARHALVEVRAAVTGIRATGLAGELASARLLLRTSDVAFESGDMPMLPDAVDDTLAMVLREAVTNIHRHARATRASVEVKMVDGHALMRVRDDGRGGVKASGNGLHGMRERLRAVGGNMRIHSLPGEGTELTTDIPMPSSDKKPLAVGKDEREPAHGNVVPLPHRAGGHS